LVDTLLFVHFGFSGVTLCSIPLMNQRESRKRVEKETEVTGTEIDAQGMIESEIETEVIETVRTIEAMIARGGAGSMIVIETGGTDTDLVQTLLEGLGIALDPSHHHDHNHVTGEASGQVGLIWHPQVQQLFQVQCLVCTYSDLLNFYQTRF
jgi:hypothetical protein